MKPWIAIILSLGAVGLVGGAGYLGYRSSHSNITPSMGGTRMSLRFPIR